MSAVVKLGSKLPADVDTNGLDAIAGQLVDAPDTVRVAVVWFDVARVVVDTDSGAHVPTVRVRRFEPLGDVASVPDEVKRHAEAAAERRTGRTPLPFDDVEVDEEVDGL